MKNLLSRITPVMHHDEIDLHSVDGKHWTTITVERIEHFDDGTTLIVGRCLHHKYFFECSKSDLIRTAGGRWQTSRWSPHVTDPLAEQHAHRIPQDLGNTE